MSLVRYLSRLLLIEYISCQQLYLLAQRQRYCRPRSGFHKVPMVEEKSLLLPPYLSANDCRVDFHYYIL